MKKKNDMNTTKLLVHNKFRGGEIDTRIYGSFVEHMGRVVYTGIYEPGHKSADEAGFRGDVIEKMQDMGVTLVRYPGGNFVSDYDWMDGIGPKETRPRKRELAWLSIETNEVGTDEFMQWVKKTEIEPMWAINLGTKGIESAVALLEYCNLPVGTKYSNLRAQNGHEKPYHIKTWCLGNEMDGEWQIGHKTAEEYGRLAHETGKAMKLLDPSIELVACGSSMSSNDTFGEWEQTVLEHTYDTIDYLSLHQYYGGQEKGTAEFLAQSLDMEKYIQTVLNICDVIKVKKRSAKTIHICFDEWGVWAISDKVVQKKVEDNPWQIAPAISEQIYTMEDALLFASMMMNFIKYSDRIKIACQSLLTNISACIMTEPGGESWVQPIYYPFAMMAKYGQGVCMSPVIEGPTYESEDFSAVPNVDTVVVYHEEQREIVLFAVNRIDTIQRLEMELQEFEVGDIIQSQVLYSEDLKATNANNHEKIKPQRADNCQMKANRLECELLPYSFQMVRIQVR